MGIIETIVLIALCLFGVRFLVKGIFNTGVFLLILAAILYFFI